MNNLHQLDKLLNELEQHEYADRQTTLKLIAIIRELWAAVELTKKHYEHPMHDHNWAYYLYEQHGKAQAKVSEIIKENER